MTTKKAAKRPTKKPTKRGPIDPNAFVKWLTFHHPCYLGLAECEARLAQHRRSDQPVETMLVEAASVSARWWPKLGDQIVSMPFLPAYLRWLGNTITGKGYADNYQVLMQAFRRAKIRKAMKRDGFKG